MSCYRRFHSSVCPDDCHSQRTSLCVKFWQSCPQFAEQVFITVNHHYNRPPTSVNLLWMLALRLFCQRSTPEHNTSSALELCRTIISANRQPLGKTRHQNHFINSLCVCGILIGCGRSEDQTVTWCHKQSPYLRHTAQSVPPPESLMYLSNFTVPTERSTFSPSTTKCRWKI